jgi:hypothetical protein
MTAAAGVIKSDLGLGYHHPKYQGDRGEGWNAERAPVPKNPVILIGQRSAVCGRVRRQVA